MNPIQAIGGFVQAHPFGVTIVHLAVLAAALVIARDDLRDEWRRTPRSFHVGAGVAALVGLVVAALVIPTFARHGWEGHEAYYFDLFLGRDNDEMHTSALLTSPLLRLVYGALALVPGMSPTSMVVVSLIVGAAAVWIAAHLGRVVTGSATAGLVTGALVALHPHQAVWSSSAYQVILPFTLALCAVLALLLAQQRGSWRLYVLAGVVWTLAVATRIEYAFLGRGLALMILWPGRRALRLWRAGAAGAAAAAALGALHVLRLGGTVAERDAGEPWVYYWGHFRQHIAWPDLWHPYDSPLTWAALAVGAVTLIRAGRWRVTAGLFALVFTFHLPYTVYYDYTTRHTLLSVVLFAAVAGAGAAVAWDRGGALRVAAAAMVLGCVVPSCLTLTQLRTRYYGDPSMLYGAVDAAAWDRQLDLTEFMQQDCYLITEWPPLWERTPCGSHVNMADPLDRPEILDDHDGCVLWLYDVDNVMWTSRDVHMRAAKLSWLYDWEVAGSITLDDGYEAAVLKLAVDPGSGPR